MFLLEENHNEQNIKSLNQQIYLNESYSTMCKTIIKRIKGEQYEIQDHDIMYIYQ